MLCLCGWRRLGEARDTDETPCAESMRMQKCPGFWGLNLQSLFVVHVQSAPCTLASRSLKVKTGHDIPLVCLSVQIYIYGLPVVHGRLCLHIRSAKLYAIVGSLWAYLHGMLLRFSSYLNEEKLTARFVWIACTPSRMIYAQFPLFLIG